MQYIERVGRVFYSVSEFYRDINPSTLSGAIDVIVIEDQEGNLDCTPFHVRFGKLKLLRPQEKVVELVINGKKSEDIRMKLGDAGESFFVAESEDPVPADYATSPLFMPESPPTALESSIAKMTLLDPVSKRPVEPREYALSDSEIEFKKADPGKSKTTDPLSDTELGRAPSTTTSSKSASHGPSSANTPAASSSAWSWGWGRLPVKKPDETAGRSSVHPPPSEDPTFPASTSLAQEPAKSSPDVHEPRADRVSSSSYRSSWRSWWSSSVQKDMDVTASQNVALSIKASEQASVALEVDEGLAKAAKGTDAAKSGQRNVNDLDTSAFKKTNTSDQEIRSEVSARIVECELEKNAIQSRTEHDGPVSGELPLERLDVLIETTASVKEHLAPLPLYGPLNVKLDSPPRAVVLDDDKNTPRERLGVVSGSPVNTNAIHTAPLSRSSSVTSLLPKAKHYVKSLRMTNTQLKSLNLMPGANTISYLVLDGRGTCCSSRIYYWRHDTKIVVSDVDGTITKSDVFGHLFTIVGRDWTHYGVAQLYSKIKQNGYEILYLTSRALGQADYTRIYLKGIEQDQYQLPDGPVVMSPDRLFTAFHREVIMRKSEDFKIACLKDIQRLFSKGGPAPFASSSSSPFYAGFGNRITDAMSYRAVGIPTSRTFTINSYGDIRLENCLLFKSSYMGLAELVDSVFPPIHASTRMGLAEDNYGDLKYWHNRFDYLNMDPTVTAKGIPGPIEKQKKGGLSKSPDSISYRSTSTSLLSRSQSPLLGSDASEKHSPVASSPTKNRTKDANAPEGATSFTLSSSSSSSSSMSSLLSPVTDKRPFNITTLSDSLFKLTLLDKDELENETAEPSSGLLEENGGSQTVASDENTDKDEHHTSNEQWIQNIRDELLRNTKIKGKGSRPSKKDAKQNGGADVLAQGLSHSEEEHDHGDSHSEPSHEGLLDESDDDEQVEYPYI